MRYSISDIDKRLENISELAEALGVDTNKIISDILLSLKQKLNITVKNTSEEMNQYLLEYVFPYAVLKDYSPLVKYLLEQTVTIPEIVMEKLLHDPSYSEFLTPSTKANIYNTKIDYFAEDIQKILDSNENTFSSQITIKDRCANSDVINSIGFDSIYQQYSNVDLYYH